MELYMKPCNSLALSQPDAGTSATQQALPHALHQPPEPPRPPLPRLQLQRLEAQQQADHARVQPAAAALLAVAWPFNVPATGTKVGVAGGEEPQAVGRHPGARRLAHNLRTARRACLVPCEGACCHVERDAQCGVLLQIIKQQMTCECATHASRAVHM